MEAVGLETATSACGLRGRAGLRSWLQSHEPDVPGRCWQEMQAPARVVVVLLSEPGTKWRRQRSRWGWTSLKLSPKGEQAASTAALLCKALHQSLHGLKK